MNDREPEHAQDQEPAAARSCRASGGPLTIQPALEAYRGGRFEEAVTGFREFTLANPNDGEALFLCGMALRKLERFQEAEPLLRQAAELMPESPEVQNGLGTVQSALGDYAQAESCFSRAIKLNPEYADAFYNKGNACQRMQAFEKARSCYQQALRLNPRDHEAWTNLGKVHHELNQLQEALAAHDQALKLSPDFPLGHWNRAIALLTAGRLEEGFRDYEWRWRMGGAIFVPRNYPQPRWNGEPISNRTLFIHAEQGFGDAIQFVRFVREARQRAAHVILECPPVLKRLFEHSACADTLISLGHPPPPFDTYAPLMSLPGLFQTTLETIPRLTPYLKPPLDNSAVADSASYLKVGLTWAGNATHDHDALRSIPFEGLAPILQTPGIVFYSLQLPLAERDKASLRAVPNLVDASRQLKDFAHTAAVIARMDLVITVDTAVAHLAGALNKPTWTLLQHAPDWRWFLARSDTPWYPTMRLFRQSIRGDWNGPIQQIRAALKELVLGGGHLPTVSAR
jgi:Tfp pilus assembly protein PilF